MEEKAIKLFQQKNIVFIATLMKDGSPQLSPVWANVHADKLTEQYMGQKHYPFKRENEKRIILKIKPENVFVMPDLKINDI
ncbi:MAG: pyridoxamine 5'-phosphate oxidase family protein [Nitrosarchaeum sp.]|nr:pyridoxamine 5'-phosphate oxidase family protein [Nitrosarchaeum sp.]